MDKSLVRISRPPITYSGFYKRLATGRASPWLDLQMWWIPAFQHARAILRGNFRYRQPASPPPPMMVIERWSTARCWRTGIGSTAG